MIARLLPSSRLAFLLSTLAGAAAAYDPALRPELVWLGAFALFVLAIDLIGSTPTAQPARGTWIALSLVAVVGTGVLLVARRGWPMLWIGLSITLLELVLFMGPRLKDTRLAGPLTVAILGPLTTAGSAMAFVGDVSPAALSIGLPIGFLADAGRRARDAGESAAPPWFAGNLVAAFGAVPVLVFATALPWSALLAWLALPLAAREIGLARGPYSWAQAAGRMRVLLAAFVMLLGASVFVVRAFATRAA